MKEIPFLFSYVQELNYSIMGIRGILSDVTDIGKYMVASKPQPKKNKTLIV